MRLPIVCACGLGLLCAALLPSQDKSGGQQKGKQGKGNSLIEPLADLQNEIKGKIEHIQVHGKSLEGNLEGDSPDRDVFVYLPPSYAAQPNRRYPVVYMLHGYGLHAQQWIGFANFGKLEKDLAAGTAKEMILVAPDAYTLENGSFYSNSKTTGDWETYVAKELVSYVDGHYRTIPNRMSRGLMGHSMGGYGTFRIGMKHPEVFSSLFSMSAGGAQETGTIAPETAQALEAVKTKEDAAKVPYAQKGSLAKAAAWSADPGNPPLFFDLPVKDGRVQPGVQEKWKSNALLAILPRYAANLKKMKAIAMNVGDMDALMPSNKDMDEALTKAGIQHTFEIFPGTHNDQVPMNFEQKVLPFFSAQLSFDAKAAAQPTGGAAQGTYARIKVHGKSLEGNLSGEPADRDVSVYLPPSYAKSANRRYPVVYLLHGYTNSDIGWFGPEGRGSFVNGNTMTAAADRAYGSGVGEAILVMPNAYTIYQGSMFSDSVTTGDWLAFVANDLVEYMDGHYRTIPNRSARGLAGHSMGGYGTFRVAAKYPDVFSSIYILSACCLSANLNPNPQGSAKAEALKGPEDAKGADRGLATLLAEAAAWSPNPKNPPFYFDLPAKDGKVQPAVVAKWVANAPLAMVDQYITSFKTLHIGHDVGDKDGLAASNRELERALTGYGIETSFEVYDGDHTNHIVDRMEKVVLPFFAKNLASH